MTICVKNNGAGLCDTCLCPYDKRKGFKLIMYVVSNRARGFIIAYPEKAESMHFPQDFYDPYFDILYKVGKKQSRMKCLGGEKLLEYVTNKIKWYIERDKLYHRYGFDFDRDWNRIYNDKCYYIDSFVKDGTLYLFEKQTEKEKEE